MGFLGLDDGIDYLMSKMSVREIRSITDMYDSSGEFVHKTRYGLGRWVARIMFDESDGLLYLWSLTLGLDRLDDVTDVFLIALYSYVNDIEFDIHIVISELKRRRDGIA